MPKVQMTHAEWLAKAKELFGDDPMDWRFTCPVCNHVQAVRDYKTAGAPESAVAFSCVGRWAGAKRDAFGLNPNKGLPPAEDSGPCNYAGGGLFAINPIEVRLDDGKIRSVFAFAEPKGGA